MFVAISSEEPVPAFAMKAGMVMHHLEAGVLWKDWFPVPMLYDTVRTRIIKT